MMRRCRPFASSSTVAPRRALHLRGVWTGPPACYRLYDAAYIRSREIVASEFPELLDLVERGVLVVHERPAEYVERRVDGYREPHRVFVLGTCHVSRQSAVQAERVVRSVQPENVVVELCRSRVSLLYDVPSNPFVLAGSNFAEAILRTLTLGGPFALAFRVLMGTLSKRMSGAIDVENGVEMKAAQKAAEELDVNVVLGDRPIEITLKRAIDALSFRRRLELLTGLLVGIVSREPLPDVLLRQVEEMDEDAMSYWTRRAAEVYPELASPLLHERDLYLAWSMKRSKAVNGTHNVVGIVGRGHLKGTYYALGHESGELRFKDLVGERRSYDTSDALRGFAKRLAVEIGIGVACYFAWTEWLAPFIGSLER